MARSRRGRRPLPDDLRKDRLVQARVDEDLDEKLRRAAKEKRVTVSQLIRNILQTTFELVDDVVAGTAHLTEAVVRDARRVADSAKGRPLRARERVYAWQEVVMNRAASCGECGAALAKGGRAFVGLQEDAKAPPLWLCPRCGLDTAG